MVYIIILKIFKRLINDWTLLNNHNTLVEFLEKIDSKSHNICIFELFHNTYVLNVSFRV